MAVRTYDLRDFLAAHAVAGLAARPPDVGSLEHVVEPELLAQRAYSIADAMLEHRRAHRGDDYYDDYYED